MDPEPVAARHVGDVGSGSTAPVTTVPALATTQNGSAPGRAVLVDLPLEVPDVHAEAAVDGDAPHVRVADAEEGRRLVDRVVAFLRGIEAQRLRRACRPSGAQRLAAALVRAAARAVKFAIEPPLVKRPPVSRVAAQRLRIQSIARRSSCAGAGAERQAVRFALSVEARKSASGGDRRARRRDVAEEARMAVVPAVRHDHVAKTSRSSRSRGPPAAAVPPAARAGRAAEVAGRRQVAHRSQ